MLGDRAGRGDKGKDSYPLSLSVFGEGDKDTNNADIKFLFRILILIFFAKTALSSFQTKYFATLWGVIPRWKYEELTGFFQVRERNEYKKNCGRIRLNSYKLVLFLYHSIMFMEIQVVNYTVTAVDILSSNPAIIDILLVRVRATIWERQIFIKPLYFQKWYYSSSHVW